MPHIVATACAAGSSPLTRGKPAGRVTSICTLGLIPAHAGKTTNTRSTRARPRAHPRSRGENISGLFIDAAAKGSSPLTRGKPIHGDSLHLVTGLIPAHAGKTTGRNAGPCARGAHPRSRGENLSPSKRSALVQGSSPLTRGKRLLAGWLPPGGGLIPAHAGKTAAVLRARSSSEAHPRSRGENSSRYIRGSPELGSSPLTRGKLRRRDRHHHRRGLIPAHAGKTRNCQRLPILRRAHPRSRGENMAGADWCEPPAGSSPLTRGKPCGNEKRRPGDGAHPRSRGENRLVVWENVRGAGSSPLTRGKPRRCLSVTSTSRLIPAHAGKTLADRELRRGPGAHPRSRGENVSTEGMRSTASGSSPLTRGKLTLQALDVALLGLIPAHAGKTGGRVRRLCD